MGRLLHGLGEALPVEVRHPRLVPDPGEPSVRVEGEAHPLLGFGAAVGNLELPLPGERHHHRPAERLGRHGRRHGLGRDPELRAEAAADEGRENPHLLGRDPQRIGQFLGILRHHLIGAAERHPVALPPGEGRVRFHRGGGHRGGAVGRIERNGGLAQGGLQIPLRRLLLLGEFGRRLGGVELGVGRGLVVHPHQPRGFAGGLEALRHHQREGLAEIGDLGRILRRRLPRHALRRMAHEAGILQHLQHAGNRARRVGGKRSDPAQGHGGPHEDAVSAVGALLGPKARRLFGRIDGPSGHFQRAFRAVDGAPDHLLRHGIQPVTLVGLVEYEMSGHAMPPVASRSAAVRARRVSGILKSFSP
jgi:hypothetical protein